MMNEQGRQPPGTQEEDRSSDELAGMRTQLASMRRRLDLAEREKTQAAERELLLRNELEHRVRNMLAIVRSIFSRTIETSPSLEHLGDHFRGRLDAVARFQAGHSLNPQNSTYLEDLIRDELNSFEFDERIDISGPEAPLPGNMTQLLGLAIHELATNSIKFGALSSTDERMRLSIRWTLSAGILRLDWQEKGVPVIGTAPMRTGFGREYIEHALPYQIGATTSFRLQPGGLICIIEIPVKRAETGAMVRTWV